ILSIQIVSKFLVSVELKNHLKNSSIVFASYPNHVGTLELDIERNPGSQANKTGRGQVFVNGVFFVPGPPYTIIFIPNCWANVDAGFKLLISIFISFSFL